MGQHFFKCRRGLERSKELKSLTPEVEELRTFKAERVRAEREATVAATFIESGLDKRHAKLFTALNPEGEVTPETVAGFAREYGLIEGSEEDTKTSDEKTGFKPVRTDEGAGLKVYTGDEALELLKSDPATYRKMVESGRVKTEKLSDLFS